MGTNAFVDTLVVTRDQDYAFVLCQRPSDPLIESPAGGREIYNRRIRRRPKRFYGGKEGLRLHHHAGSAAEGVVVGHLVTADTKGPQIDDIDPDNALVHGARHHPLG